MMSHDSVQREKSSPSPTDPADRAQPPNLDRHHSTGLNMVSNFVVDMVTDPGTRPFQHVTFRRRIWTDRELVHFLWRFAGR